MAIKINMSKYKPDVLTVNSTDKTIIENAALVAMTYEHIRKVTEYLWRCNKKCLIDVRTMETVIKDNGNILYFANLGDRISYVKQGYNVSFFDKVNSTKICDVDAEYALNNNDRTVTFGFGEYRRMRLSKDSLMLINTKTVEIETYKNVVWSNFSDSKDNCYVIRYKKGNEILNKEINF